VAESNPNPANFASVIQANFGGYLIAAVAVIVTYSVVDAIYPQYSTPLALVTLLGVALFYMHKSTPTPPGNPAGSHLM
jgi:hypothetical protein